MIKIQVNSQGKAYISNNKALKVLESGFYCLLYVYAPTGTVITVDDKTLTVSGNYVTFKLYDAGEYLITGVYQGHTQTKTIYVDSADYLSETFTFYTTITVQTQPNIVLTCDGQSITSTGTSVQFTVWETGTYTITGTLDGHTDSTSVDVYDLEESYTTSLYLYSNLTVSSDTGAVITVNGESKTITDTSVSFVVWQSGSLTITATKNGVTKTQTVLISLGTDLNVSISFSPYTEVTYIQGNGGYINTGFTPQMGDIYTFEVAKIVSATSNSKVPVWGSNFTAMNNEDETNAGIGFGTVHPDRQIDVKKGVARYWNASGNAGNWANQGFITFEIDTGSSASSTPTVKRNGTNISMTQEGEQPYYDFDTTVPIGIFCSIYNGQAVCISTGHYRMKYFKVTRGGTVVADFRAAIDGNNVAGLYDRVSDNFVAGVGNIGYEE